MIGKLGIRLGRTCALLLVGLGASLAVGATAGAVVLQPGDIVVADYNGDFGNAGAPWDASRPGGRIVKVDPATGAQTMISWGGLLDLPWGLALHPAGEILVVDRGSSLNDPTPEILAIDPVTGAQRVVSAGGLLVAPMDLDVDAAGNLLVADHLALGSGAILAVDFTTGAQTLAATGGDLRAPMDVTVSAGGDAYVSCSDPHARLVVVKVDPAAGAQTVVSPAQWCCPVDTKGIVRDEASGDLYVSEIYTHNGIFRVDGATGAQSLFSTGSPFQDPWDLTWDLGGGLVVGDGNWWGSGRVVRVDVFTGNKTVISSGGLLVDPAGVGVASGVVDADGDGFPPPEDCDDGDPEVFPGAPELCDGRDNDCDGLVPVEEQDLDGDGVFPCAGDCDDGDPLNFSGNPEACDGQDNDCDGVVDEGFDLDGDGWTTCAGDCDDDSPTVYPGHPETLCDGRDNDCDGATPDDVNGDGDPVSHCAGDCDDGDPLNFPGNPEVCDGGDNDCDGLADDDTPDGDGDGVCDDLDNCAATPNPVQDDWDGDGEGDACDDSDGDGLLDETELVMAGATGCPDPAVFDSDGDTLSDGAEVSGGTDPCRADSDGDGVPDGEDPLPTEPGVTSGYLEDELRDTDVAIQELDLGFFNGSNANANEGRRNSLSNRARNAANAVASEDYQDAIDKLTSLLQKIDGESPPPDWMDPSPEKTALAELVVLYLELLELM